ncbi:MAG: hypothetical protein IKW96_07525 [Ruminococcus sp.]|uniref:O-antigen ligase family protein n=1 Tax=Ruminococcus sp. TaxID=41978 RepID=UPI0025D0D25A|nr:hypothetical protein [Ruminococcus sp.]MBR5683115.1 hypothetical protein [Ruminococcus sp.]
MTKEINTPKNELLIALLFFLPQMNYFLVEIMAVFGLGSFTMFIYLFLGVIGLFSYSRVIKFRAAAFSTAFLLLSLAFSYLLNPATATYMFYGSFWSSGFVMLLTVYFPIFLRMTEEIDYDELFKALFTFAKITLIGAIGVFVVIQFILKKKTSDYMSFAYMSLNSVFFCLFPSKSSTRISKILGIAGCVMLLIGGCRGAFLTVSVYIVLLIMMHLFSDAENSAFNRLKWLFLTIAGLFSLPYILEKIGGLLTKAGVSSRALSFIEQFMSGSASGWLEKDGRNGIWEMAVQKLNLFGYGLFGDRTVLYEPLNPMVYAHNWILEMLLSYGVIVGAALVFVVIFGLVKTIAVARSSNNSVIVMLTFCAFSVIMIKHFISASFVISIDFWFYAGFIMNVNKYAEKLTANEEKDAENAAADGN